ncbi:MAG TPA: tetratricopeptide repeat protein [Pirellulales bacterium]|nr:tetratricopeptide repeat protein [Pirellulales bacterium]
MALGVAIMVAIELVCRLTWSRFSHAATAINADDDPFVTFVDRRPLFVLSADRSRYEIAPERLTHFRPDSFAAEKPAGEYRVFCLGGSTVQGRPFSIETSFAKFVEIALAAAEPAREFKVVNCGGVSYATYRLLPILEEVLQYQPDLIIFCEGHNEFLEDRTYAEMKRIAPWLRWSYQQVARLRMFDVMRASYRSIRSPRGTPDSDRSILPVEVDARLDWRGGLSQYHRDPVWQRDCIEHFAFNMARCVELCREQDVPLLLVNPAANLDWAPFKAEHRDGLSADELERAEQLWNEARAYYGDAPKRALQLLKQAVAIDNQHAGLMFDLGKCYQRLGLLTQAREALVRAKDLDICPLRMLEPMHERLLAIAHETGTLCIDADALLSARSPGGINGAEWFVDHVHPTIEGHELIAETIADELARRGVVHPPANWSDARHEAFRRHVASLPSSYYPDGLKRLRSEQGWAHGTSPRQRP